MAIKNLNSFTHVDFFETDDFKVIGDYGEQKLLLIGKSRFYGDPIVAISDTEEPTEELSACDLYELMKCDQNRISLTATFV